MGEEVRFRSANGTEVYERGKRLGHADRGITYEATDRWVRALIGETRLVDSRRARLLWEEGIPTSTYVFPREDVRTDLFARTAAPRDRPRALASEWFDVSVEGVTYDRLAWTYDEGPLAGYVGIDWFGRKAPGVEGWFEEEEEVFVHPRDPHHRVDAVASSRHVEVSVGGVPLAETHRPVLVFETGLPTRYYIPVEDVDFGRLQRTDLLTRCPYKGIADYWSVVGADPGKNIVWSYPEPLPAVAVISGHLAFYNEVVDIVVDGVALERPSSHFVRRILEDAPDTTGV